MVAHPVARCLPRDDEIWLLLEGEEPPGVGVAAVAAGGSAWPGPGSPGGPGSRRRAPAERNPGRRWVAAPRRRCQLEPRRRRGQQAARGGEPSGRPAGRLPWPRSTAGGLLRGWRAAPLTSRPSRHARAARRTVRPAEAGQSARERRREESGPASGTTGRHRPRQTVRAPAHQPPLRRGRAGCRRPGRRRRPPGPPPPAPPAAGR